MDLKVWKEKNAKARKYAHFDEKVSLEQVWNYIIKPDNIRKHGFYPFIHYEKKFNKYAKKDGRGYIKEKSRHLCYSAHIDRYIYSYYGYLLNQLYNEYLEDHFMNMVAVAYRDNLHKNNIHFAKRAFDYIKESKECFVIIGDFSDFFDSLNHNYLKRRICDILKTERLPDDYYAVFKNITKYSVWELTDILKINGLNDSEHDIHLLNSKRKVFSKKVFKDNKKASVVRNKENYGIPQGSAISAVLANIYMIKADEKINEIVNKYKGLYMRYSDDFIVILPTISQDTFRIILESVKQVINDTPNLILQSEKTKIYRYVNKELRNCNAEFMDNIPNEKNVIDYLGFSFDGREVTIRDKTISKYYYRMYRKLKTIVKNKGYTFTGKRISCKNLYEKYSVKGVERKDSEGNKIGNFITYVQKAQKIFGKEEPIDRKTKRHMVKIRRELDKVFK